MTPDELRALADALEPMARAPRFENFDVPAFCAWLRDGPPAAAPQAEPSAALIRAYNSGYMQGHHDTVEAQFIDIHPLDMDTYHADVVAELGLPAAPQAEPKREPLSDERIAEIQRAAYERAAALVIELTEDNATADAIRALGRQHD